MPHTVTAVVRWREMIDSFSELPKEKRPPEDIWFKAQELEEWFERVFEQRRDTTFHFTIDEVEG